MFLPIGDSPTPRGTPYVNYVLIGINIAVFILVTLPLSGQPPDLNDPMLLEYLKALGMQGPVPAQIVFDNITAYDLVVFHYGFRPAEPSLTTLFSAMFLHAGWMHIAGNMLFLWIFGDNVEHRLGRFGYLMGYLGAGLAATIFFGLFVPDSQVPMIGASGAISGVLGFYFVWFPRNQVKTFVFFFPFLMSTFLIPARFVLGFYLLVDNLLPFLLVSSEGGGVAHGAHIGGFLAGGGLALVIDRAPGFLQQRAVRQQPKPPPVSEDRSRLVEVVADIVRSIDEGRFGHAANLYATLTSRAERGQLATGYVLAVGEYLLEIGEIDQALSLFRRLISERPGDPGLDRAYLGAGKAMLRKARCETSAWHYFLSAIDVARSADVKEDARLHLKMIEKMDT